MLLANASSIFSVGNGNLIDNVLDLAGLEAAEESFGSHVTADGRPITFEPDRLLVGTALASTARQLVSPQLLASDANSGQVSLQNVFAGRFQVVKTPYLNNTSIRTPEGDALSNQSDTLWFILGNPSRGAVVTVGLLGGRSVPTIQSSATSFNTLGMQWRGYFDFGVAQGDEEYGVMSTGDASGG